MKEPLTKPELGIALRHKALRFSATGTAPGPISEPVSRRRKAEKIRRVLRDCGALPAPAGRLLDIGCSFGFITAALSEEVALSVGIDLDGGALHAAKSGGLPGVGLVQADAERLPFASGAFDCVLCSHVYEHTASARGLMSEIHRVLTPGGFCYFGAPNRFDLIEPHYRLPFLAWLPRPLANYYVRLAGRGTGYPEQPYSLRRLRTLMAEFDLIDFTGPVVMDPVRYQTDDLLPPGSLKQLVAKMVLRFLPWFFPDFIFVLRKPASQLGATERLR